MSARAILPMVCALVATSCGGGAFQCSEAADCVADGRAGICEPDGYCSFEDDACASGQRYGEHAPAAIAGMCVAAGAGDSGTAATSDEGAPDAGPVTTVVPSTGEGETTLLVGDSGSSDGSGTTASSLDGAQSTSADASTSDAGTTTTLPEIVEVEIAATIAVCTEDGVFDPDACAAEAGVDQFTLDLSDTDGNLSTGWLRFDVDDTLVGAEILAVELVLTVGPDRLDGSDMSGELWLTETFDIAALQTGYPVTTSLAASDLGATTVSAEVTFALAPDVVTPGASICFALVPLTSDGVDYWSHTSATPPTLVMTAQR